jgi:hypothetical protein
MHGATVKIVDAKQARLHNSFKNTKCKLLRTNAAIWFNKMCRMKPVKPNYINIRINGQKQQDKRTTTQAIRYRINQDIKFLYRKKQLLNQQLYSIHLKCAQHHNGMWQYVQNIIESKLKEDMNTYEKLIRKLDLQEFTSRSPTDKNTKYTQMKYTCGHILRNNTNSTNANQREE